MKNRNRLIFQCLWLSVHTSFFVSRAFVSGIVLLLSAQAVAAQTASSFTYQGYLQDSGASADGQFELEFKLYEDDQGITQIGLANTVTTSVADGLFTVELDFGSGAFDGQMRWLQISVRPAGSGSLTPLLPLQRLTPAPYALFAFNGGNGGLPPGVIVMWSGPVSGIPSGWTLCDGTNGTPDLRDRFIIGSSAGEDPGATGGSGSHIHSIGSGGNHSHGGGTTGASNNNFTVDGPDGGSERESVPDFHTHNFSTSSSGGHGHSANSQTHLPPYFKLAFVMKCDGSC